MSCCASRSARGCRGADSTLSSVPLRLPQARDFDKLRHLLRLVADGHSEPKEIGIRMGAGPNHPERHAGYYREAAEVLGLLESRGNEVERATL
jgi:hypothetical protein